jgi:hypothetical protein
LKGSIPDPITSKNWLGAVVEVTLDAIIGLTDNLVYINQGKKTINNPRIKKTIVLISSKAFLLALFWKKLTIIMLIKPKIHIATISLVNKANENIIPATKRLFLVNLENIIIDAIANSTAGSSPIRV